MLNHDAIDSMHEQLATGKISALTLIAAMRLEYLNAFLSPEGFARHHNIPLQHAASLINLCRSIHEESAQ